MRSLAQQSGLVLAVTKGRVSLIYSDLAGFPQSLASPISDSDVQEFIVSTDNP